MPEYIYDKAIGLLVVTHDGREVYRVANLPENKVKETLQAFLVKSDDGEQFAFIDESKGFELKPAIDEPLPGDVEPDPTLINPADCPNVDCPMRTKQETAKGLE